MPKRTDERWNALEVRSTLHEYHPDLLALLDAFTRSRGVDPATATIGHVLALGGEIACMVLHEREQLTLRQAEGGLTHSGVTPTAFSRQLERSRTITVRPPHTDQ